MKETLKQKFHMGRQTNYPQRHDILSCPNNCIPFAKYINWGAWEGWSLTLYCPMEIGPNDHRKDASPFTFQSKFGLLLLKLFSSDFSIENLNLILKDFFRGWQSFKFIIGFYQILFVDFIVQDQA